MRTLVYALSLTLVTAGGEGKEPPTPSGDFAVHCGKLYDGKGRSLERAWLVIRSGKIEALRGDGPAPEGLPILDALDKVVMPGIVAADTDLSGHQDTQYSVTPDFTAIDGFDFMRRYTSALSGGVTSVYLAPGRNRLIPGQGSVVKLHGKDLVERVLSESSCLRITLGKASTDAPLLFEPTPHPTSDDPLLPARRQYPSARISQLATLRRLFAQAAVSGEQLLGTGSGENRFVSSSLRQVSIGMLPLRIAARAAADIRRGIDLAEELEASCVLEDPYQIEQVAAYAAKHGAMAVFRMPIDVSASNSGGEDRRDKRPTSMPENAAIAAAAGMTIALAPGRDSELVDFLMIAGIGIRYGMSRDQALRAITSDAAVILGVDSRVGSLEAGKDADFLVLSGEPFAVGTMVEKTFISGEPAYERETDSNILAVRCAKIITGEGDVLHDAVIIVANGKIKALGEDLTIPYGARVLDLGESTMVPGFIDAYSSLGLSGDGTEIPPGSADQLIADVIDPRDPLFRRALQAGLTTIMVSGRDDGPVSGRVTAIKLGAEDRSSMVLREIAGIRMVHDGIGPDAIKSVIDTLERGRKYILAWEKYEKALADFKAGKGKKPEVAQEQEEETPVEDPLSGIWELEISGDIPAEVSVTLDLELDGSTVTGTMTMSMDGNEMPAVEIQDGKFEGKTLTMSMLIMGNQAEFVATVEDDTMIGSLQAGPMTAEIQGRRVQTHAAGDSTAKDDDDSDQPTKPKIDESLEPIKALLEKRIPAVIRSDRAPAVKALIALFEKEQLPYILHGVKDAIDTPEILGKQPPAVMLGPELVRREGRKVINAAATLADRNVRLALVTGDTAGSSYLPLHVAHAIRYGMDPQAALRALTLGPAEMFMLDDRIGSLRRGKDADFVVFTGNPFEMTSRVLLVVSDGHIVVDQRSKENGR